MHLRWPLRTPMQVCHDPVEKYTDFWRELNNGTRQRPKPFVVAEAWSHLRQFDMLFSNKQLHDSYSVRTRSGRHPICWDLGHSNPRGGFRLSHMLDMLDMLVLVVRGNGIDILWSCPARHTSHAILAKLAPSPAEDGGSWPRGDSWANIIITLLSSWI
jgi:hypothetical protein